MIVAIFWFLSLSQFRQRWWWRRRRVASEHLKRYINFPLFQNIWGNFFIYFFLSLVLILCALHVCIPMIKRPEQSRAKSYWLPTSKHISEFAIKHLDLNIIIRFLNFFYFHMREHQNNLQKINDHICMDIGIYCEGPLRQAIKERKKNHNVFLYEERNWINLAWRQFLRLWWWWWCHRAEIHSCFCLFFRDELTQKL